MDRGGHSLTRHSGFLAVAAAASLAVAHNGCAVERPKSTRSTVTIAWEGPTALALHPNTSESPQFLVFLPLVALDENGEWTGRLAESWEPSEEFSEWTFHLRRDAYWQDGVPVTAHDVKFSLELLMHPEVNELPPHYFDSIEVLDDHTIALGSSRFVISNAMILWTVYYPRHILEPLDPAAVGHWEFWTRPVGNGPYLLARYMSETSMEFEINPEYFGSKPEIDRVVLKFSAASAQQDLLGGQIDAAAIESTTLARFTSDPRFDIYYQIIADVANAVYWKCDHPILQDARVRRALTLAVDRPGLLQALDLWLDLPIVDGPYSPPQLRQGSLPEALPYDPDAAAKLLEEAGWIDRDGNGIREKGDLELRFSAITRAYSQRVAVLLQSHFVKVGAHMDIELLETSVVLSRQRSGDFEAAIGLGGVAPGRLLADFGAGGTTGYRNSRVAELLERQQTAADPQELGLLADEIYQIFRQEQPAMFLFPSIRPWVVNRRLHGLSTPWVADPIGYLDRLRIKE